MKETMKLDDKKLSNEFFDFHEKVNKILEDQEEIFSIHMAAIKVKNEQILMILHIFINFIIFVFKMEKFIIFYAFYRKMLNF